MSLSPHAEMPDVNEGHMGITVVTPGHGADERLDLGKEDRIVIFGLLIVSYPAAPASKTHSGVALYSQLSMALMRNATIHPLSIHRCAGVSSSSQTNTPSSGSTKAHGTRR